MSAQAPKKLKNPRKQIGAEILSRLPTYRFENEGQVPVTCARMHVKLEKIKSPAIIIIRRNKHTIDRFYLSKNGMFSADYAEYNYFNFFELRELLQKLVQQGEIRAELQQHCILSLANHVYEKYNYEFAWV